MHQLFEREGTDLIWNVLSGLLPEGVRVSLSDRARATAWLG